MAQAGGLPVLLPPLPGIAALLPRLDGLVLSGGGDIDPARTARRGTRRGPAQSRPRQRRAGAVPAALASGLPLLGICRGLQVINVALGGTLHQHLPDLVGHDGIRRTAGTAATR